MDGLFLGPEIALAWRLDKRYKYR